MFELEMELHLSVYVYIYICTLYAESGVQNSHMLIHIDTSDGVGQRRPVSDSLDRLARKAVRVFGGFLTVCSMLLDYFGMVDD
jgi:hypothetical protein